MQKKNQHPLKTFIKTIFSINFYKNPRSKQNIRLYDEFLIVLILLSIVIVLLDSTQSLHIKFKDFFVICEWFFVIIFTIEYLLRVYFSKNKRGYIFSFYGIIDFIAVFPSYLSLFLSGTTSLFVIRAFRLLRVFRILKLLKYLEAVTILISVLKEGRHKIAVFLTAVTVFVIFMGSVMFFIEGEENGFTSIPRSIYWSIVTITTVGYGDITPKTTLGQMVASFLMIISYGVIAIPVGIISSSLTKYQASKLICPRCQTSFHDSDAKHCKLCGSGLRPAIIAKTHKQTSETQT